MTAPVDHQALGSLSLVRNAVRMTGTAPTVRTPAPGAGADTETVLAEVGLTADEIAELRRAGAIREEPR
jgi:formyl-CoA transferase